MVATIAAGMTPALAIPRMISGWYSRATLRASARHSSPKNGQSTSRMSRVGAGRGRGTGASGVSRHARRSGQPNTNHARPGRALPRPSARPKLPGCLPLPCGASSELVEEDPGRRRRIDQAPTPRLSERGSRARTPRRFRGCDHVVSAGAPGRTRQREYFSSTSRSRCRLGRGRQEEAIRHYRRALELQPDLAGAHYGLAFLLRRRGDVERAAEHLRAFLAPATRSGDGPLGRARPHRPGGDRWRPRGEVTA